jgi:hypothetical protein
MSTASLCWAFEVNVLIACGGASLSLYILYISECSVKILCERMNDWVTVLYDVIISAIYAVTSGQL